jgi:hypothetical protein
MIQSSVAGEVREGGVVGGAAGGVEDGFEGGWVGGADLDSTRVVERGVPDGKRGVEGHRLVLAREEVVADP